jgi:hypothetical protein
VNERRTKSHADAVPSFSFRRATMGDLAELVRVEEKAWAPEHRAARATIGRRLEISDQSYLVYSANRSEAVGSIVAVPLTDFDFEKPAAWDHYAELSQSEAHNRTLVHPKYLYVVSIGAVVDAPRGTGSALFRNLVDVARSYGMEGVLSGIRVPGFAAFTKKSGVGIEQYLKLLQARQVVEESYGAAIQSGGVPLRCLENYFDDPASANYGILMIHRTLAP